MERAKKISVGVNVFRARVSDVAMLSWEGHQRSESKVRVEVGVNVEQQLQARVVSHRRLSCDVAQGMHKPIYSKLYTGFRAQCSQIAACSVLVIDSSRFRLMPTIRRRQSLWDRGDTSPWTEVNIITNVPLNIYWVISATFYPCNIFLMSWKSSQSFLRKKSVFFSNQM